MSQPCSLDFHPEKSKECIKEVRLSCVAVSYCNNTQDLCPECSRFILDQLKLQALGVLMGEPRETVAAVSPHDEGE